MESLKESVTKSLTQLNSKLAVTGQGNLQTGNSEKLISNQPQDI